MFNLNNKLEKIAGAFFIAGLVVLGSSFKSSPQKWVNSAKIIFEVPRPTNFLAALGFDFEGREIERLFENPFAKKETKDDSRAPAAKEAAAAAAEKKAEAKKTAAKSNKSKLEVNVVNESDDGKFNLGDDDKLTMTQENPEVQNVSVAKAEDAGPTATDKEKTKVTPAQWKALLLPQPTPENLNKFLSAYLAKEVDDGTFYGILGTILKENKPENQKMALDVLAQVSNAKAFILIAMSLDAITADNQTLAADTLKGFGMIQKLGSMNVLLSFPDSVVVVKALDAFNNGYATAYMSTQNNTTGAGLTAQDITNAYSKYLPTIRKLAQSDESVIAQAAQQTLNQFETQVASL